MSMSSIAELVESLRKGDTNHIPKLSYEEFQQKKVDDYNDTEGNLNDYDGYDCRICKNKGFTAKLNEDKYEVHCQCKCSKIRATLRRAMRSGLGNILTDNTFDKFIDSEDWQKEIKRTAQAFCQDDTAKWFFIGGQVGSGKSHICTAICGHYIKAGQEVRYMIWAEEAKKLKALVNDKDYQGLISEYKDVDVLYIDDFLKVKFGEEPTAADINLAFEIINHRLVEGGKITIISSEKTLDEIMEYDEATMSRIYQKTGQYKLSIGRDRSRNYRLKG